jgi:cytochrome c oxidase assembly protein Cox11
MLDLSKKEEKTLREITEKYDAKFELSLDEDGKNFLCKIVAGDGQSFHYKDKTKKSNGVLMKAIKSLNPEEAMKKAIEFFSTVEYFTWNLYEPNCVDMHDDC